MKVRELFDECAQDYDRDRPKLVPDFDGFYGTALRVIPFPADAPIKVLDLGAGTGLLSAMVATAFPRAMLHLTDIAEAMLAQAKVRFGDDSRFSYAAQEHLELADEGAYDLVISALSIHHLEHGPKAALYKAVHKALRPGGLFLNADQVRAPTDQGEADYERRWLEDVRMNGVSEETLAKAKVRMMEDRNAPLSDQLRWLEEAGFEEVDCWYKRFRFAVFGGRKAAPR